MQYLKNELIIYQLREDPSLPFGKSFAEAITPSTEDSMDGVHQEYQIIEAIHGEYARVRQQLVQQDGHAYDIVTISVDGAEVDYYFLIDLFFGKF